MGTKNITITEEAYERLQALKRDEESFSELVTQVGRTGESDSVCRHLSGFE